MKLTRLGVYVTLSLALNGYSLADIFRCQKPSGELVFQATRCAAEDSRPLTLSPLNVLGEPLRPGERALLVDQVNGGQRNARKKSRKPKKNSEARRSAERCLSKRQKLAAVSAKLRRGYKPAQGERLRRRRDEYEVYIRRFCE